MKLLRYLFVFREFILIALLFMTIERLVSNKQLDNYINPDYHIFVHLALVILLIFAAFAMILASARDLNDKFSGTAKYIVFIILLILMNLPHDNKLFYEHLQEEREFTLQADPGAKTGKKSISEITELNHDKAVLPVEPSGNNTNNVEVFKIQRDNFFSAAEDIFANPEKYRSLKLNIRGFVYKLKKLKENRYIIARLVMYCCAADAGITGLIFNADKTGETFKKDQWLELSGYIEMQNAGSIGKSDKVPVLVVESYKRIPPESSPYIYPVY